MCGLVDAGKSWSEVSTRYNAERHAMTKRHIKNTTPKTRPETAQEAKQPILYEATLRDMTAKQAAELAGLVSKWIAEEGKGVH